MSPVARRVAAAVAVWLLSASAASADEIRVLMSRAFTVAYLELVRAFESTSAHTVTTAFGASMGHAADSVPNRLRRGTSVDVIIVAAATLDELIAQGKVTAGSRVDLVRSGIGLAVRAGAPEPDISTVDALRRTLLDAKSIAFSNSASGVYVSTELFQRLGIADRVRAKSGRFER
jgi:molybdate transport system substrate-binding protein